MRGHYEDDEDKYEWPRRLDVGMLLPVTCGWTQVTFHRLQRLSFWFVPCSAVTAVTKQAMLVAGL